MKKNARWLLLGLALWMAGFLTVELTHAYHHHAADGNDSSCIVCVLNYTPTTPAPTVDAATLVAAPALISLPAPVQTAESAAPSGLLPERRASRAPPAFS